MTYINGNTNPLISYKAVSITATIRMVPVGSEFTSPNILKACVAYYYILDHVSYDLLRITLCVLPSRATRLKPLPGLNP